LIHNKGIANEIYISKAGSHARVKNGISIPMDTVYFMESFEACLQYGEWLEIQLHEKWYSNGYENSRNKAAKKSEDLPQESIAEEVSK